MVNAFYSPTYNSISNKALFHTCAINEVNDLTSLQIESKIYEKLQHSQPASSTHQRTVTVDLRLSTTVASVLLSVTKLLTALTTPAVSLMLKEMLKIGGATMY